MACDVPCMSYMALYVISLHLVNSSSRSSASTSSQHWKLNVSAGKVEPAEASTENGSSDQTDRVSPSVNFTNGTLQENTSKNYSSNNSSSELDQPNQDESYEDRMMQILSSKVASAESWVVLDPGTDDPENCIDCHSCTHRSSNLGSCSSTNKQGDQKLKDTKSQKGEGSKPQKPLTCGKKVNSTVYDHLKGVSERHLHSHIPEPDVAVVFQNLGKSAEVDMTDLEQRLRDMRQEVEQSLADQRVQVYNLIGNFWRIKGNTQMSIECFRKALSISPNDSSVLLNLARVLLNLQYLEDAIFLSWRSLQLYQKDSSSSNLDSNTNPPSSPWLQHFTLGQALRALAERGSSEGNIDQNSLHAQQAAAHFQQALAFNPSFSLARLHLLQLQASGFSGTADIAVDWLGEEDHSPSSVDKDDSSNLPSVVHLTLFVLLSVVVGLLSGVFISLEASLVRGDGEESGSSTDSGSGSKSSNSQLQTSQQRHFNRAMAMRSMKLGMNRKACPRSRKNNGSGF